MKWIRSLLLLPTAGAVALASACSSEASGVSPFDIGTADNASEVTCEVIDQVAREINRIADEQEPEQKAEELSAWGIENGDTQIQKVTDALSARQDDCQKESAETQSSANAEVDTDCPEKFQQEDLTDQGKPHDVIPGGLSGDEKKDKERILEVTGKDASRLLEQVTQLHMKELPKDWKNLVTEGCLNEAGQKLHARLQTVLDEANWEKAKAPASDTNTGWNDGRLNRSGEPGISGNRDAWNITPAGSDEPTTQLLRCGNFTLPSNEASRLPVGPTDQTPPGKKRHDECPNKPGDQPPGYPCPKTGQTGSIAAGNHDPQGGTPGPGNVTEPTAQNQRPVVSNPDRPGSTPVQATPPPAVQPTTGGGSTTPVNPGTQPPNNGTVNPDPPPGQPCNPDFQDC